MNNLLAKAFEATFTVIDWMLGTHKPYVKNQNERHDLLPETNTICGNKSDSFSFHWGRLARQNTKHNVHPKC